MSDYRFDIGARVIGETSHKGASMIELRWLQCDHWAKLQWRQWQVYNASGGIIARGDNGEWTDWQDVPVVSSEMPRTKKGSV